MFDRLDPYNLIANLVPGATLSYALHHSGFPIPQPSNIAAFLLVAFVAGVTANRLGSLAFDPLLRKLKFLRPKDYDAFVTSAKNDDKLETLVANTGLYRTFFTAGFLYFILLLANVLADYWALTQFGKLCCLIILGMLVFLLAFRKEDDYIHKRMNRPK